MQTGADMAAEYENYKCYGKWYNRIAKCETCPAEIKDYCREARNPATLTESGKAPIINYDDIKFSEEYAGTSPSVEFDADTPDSEKPLYSKNDLLELLSFVCACDERALELLDEKFKNPDIEYSKIAKKKKLSRQAIHQLIQRRCEAMPELETVLRNRKRKMEAKTNKKNPFIHGGSMSNQKTNTREEIDKARKRLEILEEIDLLESEFGLIKNEYLQRLGNYKNQLADLEI